LQDESVVYLGMERRILHASCREREDAAARVDVRDDPSWQEPHRHQPQAP
jgi:hypothetical protein